MRGSDTAVPILVEAVLAEVYAHASAGYPEEVCGLLVGTRGAEVVDELRRCENRQNALHAQDPEHFPRDARSAYNLDAKDLFFLDRSLRGERPVRVIYHSHVDVGSYFSVEDRVAAVMDGELLFPVDYLVVDAQRDGARGARLFRYERGDWIEIAAYGTLVR